MNNTAPTAPIVARMEQIIANLSIVLGSDQDPAVVTYNGHRFKANVVSDPTGKVTP